jgi:hypothetical protein
MAEPMAAPGPPPALKYAFNDTVPYSGPRMVKFAQSGTVISQEQAPTDKMAALDQTPSVSDPAL